jgi:hypothetical protein
LPPDAQNGCRDRGPSRLAQGRTPGCLPPPWRTGGSGEPPGAIAGAGNAGSPRIPFPVSKCERPGAPGRGTRDYQFAFAMLKGTPASSNLANCSGGTGRLK